MSRRLAGMVTLSGTAKVMLRSWHSSTSYFELQLNGDSPQTSHTSPRAIFACPHSTHSGLRLNPGNRTCYHHPAAFECMEFEGARSPVRRPHLHSHVTDPVIDELE